MSKKYLGFICFIYSAIIFYVWISGLLRNFLAPNMQLYLKISAFVFIPMGLVLLFNNRVNYKFKISDLILLLPIVLLIIAGDGRLTASLANNRFNNISSNKNVINENKEENKEEVDNIVLYKSNEKGKKGKKKKNKNNIKIIRNDTTQRLNNEEKKNNEKNEDKKITFCIIFKKTFLNSHPIFSIFNRKPSLMSYLFFIFTMINYFGFNILFYSDNLITKRIDNKDRDTYLYPLKNQKMKIISSFISSIILTLFLKLIAWNCYGNNIKKQGKARRTFSGLLIILISFFFLFYSSIFCYLYQNTQKSFMNSGVICIIIDWVLLSPIFILIFSLLACKGLKCSHNLSELFPL
jgi:hypothetical protein